MQEVLGVERVGLRDDFFALGGDSIASLQVASRARARSIELRPGDIFRRPTVAELAHHLEARAPGEVVVDEPQGEFPLAPVQRWFFRHVDAGRHHFNQAVLLELASPTPPERLRDAWAAVVARHDALRSRFRLEGGAWSACVEAEPEPPAFESVDLAWLAEGEADEQLRARCEQAHASLDLERGPLHRAVHFERDEGAPPLLLLVAHHLVVDGVSWRVLIEDLALQLRGDAPPLPPKTASYRAWARRLAELGAGDRLGAHRAFWSSLPWGELGPEHFGRGSVGEARTFSRALGPRETALLLQRSPALHRTGAHELLAACALYALARSTGRRTVAIDVEGHGRDDEPTGLDVARTVGWFTALYPVVLGCDDWADLDVVVRRVDAFFRALPARGITFGVLDG
ncbi:MAG TPA: condensation domain-containing protein, partial [Polyangiaceae bacterium]|nr:condensation domain-containing protein [Polyangiaceae bacterium]